MNLLVRASIWAIVFYQNRWAPRIDGTCRHWPSCSQYTVLALQRYGFVRGWRVGLHRVSDCHPGTVRPYIDVP